MRNLSAVCWLITLLLGASSAFADLTMRQLSLLSNNCMQCHANAETSAPVYAVVSDWQYVLEQTESQTLANVIQGINGMPPLGYCSACSEEDFLAMIRFFLQPVEERR